MGEMSSLGKTLLLTGIVIAAIGGVLIVAARWGGLPRIPGDIVVQKKNFTFFFPLGTSILLSLLLTLILWLLNRK